MRNLINRLSIGKKIIGLVTVALVIMVIAALHAYLRISTVNREVMDLTQISNPVAEAIGTIDAGVLEEQLHLERVQRLSAARPAEIARMMQEADFYKSKVAQVDRELENGTALLARGIQSARSKQEAVDLVRIEHGLQDLGKQHRKLGQQGANLLESLLSGNAQPSSALQDAAENAQDDFDSAEWDGVWQLSRK